MINICLKANYSLIFNLFFDEIRKNFPGGIAIGSSLEKSVRCQHV